MFDIQIGDKLSIKSTKVGSPLLILGNYGQGKTTTLEQIVLKLIKSKQKGILYDPYGDLVKDIQKYATSDKAKKHFAIFEDDISALEITEEEFGG